MAATITLRVDDDTKTALEALADARGLTVSDVLRAAIDRSLDRAEDEPASRRPSITTLSLRDRHSLAMQHDVLALLSQDGWEKEHHETRARVFREGMTYEYGDEFEQLYPEISYEDCRLVRDVLSMFDGLKASIDRLPVTGVDDLTESKLSRLRFGGFDGNDSREGRMAGYVKHLLSEDLWHSIKDDWQAADRGNSHMPTLSAYRRQLQIYTPMWRAVLDNHSFSGPLLTLDQLRRVAEAWSYPRA